MMQTLKSRSGFFETEEAKDIQEKLQHMMSSNLYNTESSFTSNGYQYPDNQIPFVDKHMNYLNSHPKLDTGTYLANLRLMTRRR
ncbi:MAG: hypothetical protein ACHQT9_03480 [Candidatus Saccharimonadales bacterium]